MDFTPVTSSTIKEVAYEEELRKLFIRFNNERLYTYSDVSKRVHTELINAVSVGKYFHANIKGQFAFEKMEE